MDGNGVCARRRDEHGASAVEFALIAIPLFTLLVGVIQMSVLLWAYQAGSHAAGEGARRYSVDPCGSYNALVVSRLGSATTDPAATVVNVTKAGGDTVGGTVTVRVTYPVARIAGALIPGIPNTLTKESTARIEDIQGCSTP